MVGGTTGGYSATGSLNKASRPTMTMTMDRTDANIGRSIKKWENFIAVNSSLGGGDGDGGARGIYLCARAQAHQAIDDNPIVGKKASAHDAKSVNHRTHIHNFIFDSIGLIHRKDEFLPLIGADGLIGNKQGGGFCGTRHANAGKESRLQSAIGIGKDAAGAQGSGGGVHPVVHEI